MGQAGNIAEFPRPKTGGASGEGDCPLEADRRKNERQIATFRTCCVIIDGEAHAAILRNVSDGGAMFEALVEAKRGDLVTYWWDGVDAIEARVAWVDGHRIGVANLSGPAQPHDVPCPRATRVPVHLPVRVWAGCKGHRAEVDNISLSGIAVHGLRGIAVGTLCTIEIGGQALHNASVVRVEDGITGIKFERPLPPARLMQLVEGEQPSAREDARPVGVHTPEAATPDPAEGEARAPAPAPLRRFL